MFTGLFHCILAAAATASAISISSDDVVAAFKAYNLKYNRTYETGLRGELGEEEAKRFSIFAESYRFVQTNSQGNLQLELNFFADRTPEERQQYMGLARDVAPRQYLAEEHAGSNKDLPKELDWRKSNVVTPVKNQKMCGSCWAFSTTGCVEGAYALKHGRLESFSEQQLVDCADKCHGCEGGLMEQALEYVVKNGLETEANYKYVAQDKQCQANSTELLHPIKSWYSVKSCDEDAVMRALQKGPLAIALAASSPIFQLYKSGVISTTFSLLCGYQLNHGVLLVGYGTLDGQDYWLIKNSWSSTWGDKGYVRLGRGHSWFTECGLCNVLKDVSGATA